MFRASDNQGVMTAVKAPLDKLEKVMQQSGTGVVLANKNSNEQGVLSGTEQNMLKAESICRDNGFLPKASGIRGFSHSMMKNAHDAFQKFFPISILLNPIFLFFQTPPEKCIRK
jgi:malonyl CoA-acyl carrier protein transacylase